MKRGARSRKLILEEFAKRVRQRRYELDLTQEELAERADFHVNYIGYPFVFSLRRQTRETIFKKIVKLIFNFKACLHIRPQLEV